MIYIFDPDLTGYHELSHAETLQMTEYYNDIGTFTLTLPVDAYNIAHVVNGAVVYRRDTGQSFVVERVEHDTANNRITANGYTANRLLNRRVFYTSAAVQTLSTDLYPAISENLRSLAHVTVSSVAPSVSETTDAVLYGTEICDTVIELLEALDVGHRMRFDTATRKHVFEIYKGQDLTSGSQAVVFSEEHGTAQDLVIENDETTLKNYVYVQGELTGGTTILETVGDSAAEDLRELWLDSKLKQDKNETEAAFRLRLQAKGTEELAKRIRRLNFSVVPRADAFGSAYKLGDMVSCVSKRFGVKFHARIKCAKYTLDAGGEKIEIVLGDPQLDVIGEMKLWQK